MRIRSHNHGKERCHRQARAPRTGDPENGFFARLFASVVQQWQGEAHRYMARQLSQSGGRLTDEMERRLSEHLIGNANWRP
jgi:hypothetical protein